MPYHTTVNYSAAVPNTGAVTRLGAPVEQGFSLQNGQYQTPVAVKLGAYTGFIPDVTSVALRTSSQRQFGFPVLDPNHGAPPAVNRPPVIVMGDSGPAVIPTEEFSFDVTRAGAAAAPCFVVSHWIDRLERSASGQAFSVRCTSTITGVVGAWAFGPLVFDNSPNAGDYIITGIQTYGVGVLASRLVMWDQTFRPGSLARETQGTFNGEEFRRGNMGPLGRFSNTALPQLEIFCHAANTTQVTYLDVIKR